MQKRYRRKLAPSFLAELTRLKNGTVAEKQRYANTLAAMNKVMSDPVHAEFRKNLPESYKAADVLQQYRLFFKIVSDADGDLVFFVWINDEESIHRTGKPDDCYAVFTKMVERGEIEPYSPEAKPTNEGFKRHEQWGAEYVYVTYWRRVQRDEQRADSHLILNHITAKNYLLQTVTVSTEGVGLAKELLRHLCDDADQHGIELTFELGTSEAHFPKSRHLLEKAGFEFDEIVDDTEIWSRKPRSRS